MSWVESFKINFQWNDSLLITNIKDYVIFSHLTSECMNWGRLACTLRIAWNISTSCPACRESMMKPALHKTPVFTAPSLICTIHQLSVVHHISLRWAWQLGRPFQYEYAISHCADKTTLYLHNIISYTGEITSSYQNVPGCFVLHKWQQQNRNLKRPPIMINPTSTILRMKWNGMSIPTLYVTCK